jgi:hypothetical protein
MNRKALSNISIIFFIIVFIILWALVFANLLNTYGNQIVNENGLTGIEALLYGNLNLIVAIVLIIFIIAIGFGGGGN